MRTLAVRGERRRARDASHVKSFRTRFFGFFLAWNLVWNEHCLGRGVLSVLRLHPLLRPIRLHLCPAWPVRLPALRAAGKLLCAPCRLHFRHSPGADHGAISAGNGDRPDAVSFQPPRHRRRPMTCRYSPAPALPSAGSILAALATLAVSASVASFFALSPLPG